MATAKKKTKKRTAKKKTAKRKTKKRTTKKTTDKKSAKRKSADCGRTAILVSVDKGSGHGLPAMVQAAEGGSCLRETDMVSRGRRSTMDGLLGGSLDSLGYGNRKTGSEI